MDWTLPQQAQRTGAAQSSERLQATGPLGVAEESGAAEGSAVDHVRFAHRLYARVVAAADDGGQRSVAQLRMNPT